MEIEINDKNFEKEVLEKSKKIPVVVDFWASWCGPCMALAPILEKLAKKYEKKFILAKLSIEKNRQIPEEHNIMSIPCVKMFKSGEVVDSFVGLRAEENVEEWLNSNL